MGTTTIYDVKVRYLLDNRASQGIKRITADAEKAAAATNKMSMGLGRVATALAAAFGARAAGKALIGFNSTVEDTKVQIAGMLSLARKTDLADQIKNADKLYASLQRRARSLPGTTQEYVNMASKLTRVIVDAGGSAKELEDMTVASVVAAKSLGEQWEVAARDIEQALMGRYNTTDPFLSKILPTIGYKGEEGREKWRALSSEKRLAEMSRALGQKQIAQLAAAQGGTFSGVMSTLQDTMQQTLGKVGAPLFRKITAEIKSWNAWMDANQGRVDRFAQRVGDALVTGFTFVRDAVGFLIDHADTLIAIGKVLA